MYSTTWKFVKPLQNLWKCNFNKIREIFLFSTVLSKIFYIKDVKLQGTHEQLSLNKKTAVNHSLNNY